MTVTQWRVDGLEVAARFGWPNPMGAGTKMFCGFQCVLCEIGAMHSSDFFNRLEQKGDWEKIVSGVSANEIL